MRLVIECPGYCSQEEAYAVQTVVGDFLGLAYEARFGGVSAFRLSLAGCADSVRLEIDASFFRCAQGDWLGSATLPRLPLVCGHLEEGGHLAWHAEVPILFGSVSAGARLEVWDEDAQCLRLGLDVFGSAFFMLSRYEEAVRPERDEHGRFPRRASTMHLAGCLGRPLVNEYVEVLWSCLRRLWPELERAARMYVVSPTHDVDRLRSVVGMPLSRVTRTVAADLLSRRDVALAWRRVRLLCARRASVGSDPFNTFEYIMATSEALALESHFFFMTVAGTKGCDYELDDSWIQSVMKEIGIRGHKIGLHAVGGRQASIVTLEDQYRRLVEVASHAGVRQDDWGVRFHYLLWQTPESWAECNRVGLAFDFSLGFPEGPGFRSGTCYDYRAYDIVARCPLSVWEVPLVVMDVALPGVVEGNVDVACEEIDRLARQCRSFSGHMTILWHNNMLVSKRQQRLYERCLEIACGRMSR